MSKQIFFMRHKAQSCLKRVVRGWPRLFKQHFHPTLKRKSACKADLLYLGEGGPHTTLGSKGRTDHEFVDHILSLGHSGDFQYGNPIMDPKAVYDSMNKFAKGAEIKLSAEENRLLDVGFDWCFRHFSPYMQGVSEVSSSEVINSMDLTKSAGQPWSEVHKSKADFFESGDSSYLNAYWESLANEGSGPTSVWSLFLKDELIPLRKVKSGQTRTVCNSPVEHVWALGRLNLSINDALQAVPVVTSSCMGINPYDGGWETLYRKLSRYAHGFALDERAWDASLIRPLLERVRDLRWRFLRPSYNSEGEAAIARKRLCRLYEDIINTVVTTGIGEYFQMTKGGPSGSGNTGPDNTFILYSLLAAAYYQSTGRNYAQFQADVMLAIYGDDNTFTVNPDVIDRFNGRFIKDFMARFGVEVKDENLDPRPLDELDFLKKHFVKAGRSVVFRPVDPDKHIASLALRMTDPSPSGRLGRACAVRQLLVFAPREYTLVDTWCQKLISTYGKSLANDPSWVGAIGQYLPLDTLVAHFLRPQESGQAAQCVVSSLESDPRFKWGPSASKPHVGGCDTPAPAAVMAPLPARVLVCDTPTRVVETKESKTLTESTSVEKTVGKSDGVLKPRTMTNPTVTQTTGLTKTQRKNARRRARKREEEPMPARKVHTAYFEGKGNGMSVIEADFKSFHGLDQTSQTWTVHTIRVKYIDASAAPEGIVKLTCGGKTVADQAGKSPQVWVTTPSQRKVTTEPAARITVDRTGKGDFMLEVSVTATLYQV